MISKRDIKKRLERLTETVNNHPEIDVLYLFGSQATREENNLSDIDLAVLLGKAVERAKYFDLRLKYISVFAEALGTDAIDIIVLNDAPAHLGFRIISLRDILYERNPPHRVEFELRVVNQFLDFRPFLEVRKTYIKKQLDEGVFFG
jgi:predicted nucleotidyltransferase